MNVMLSNVKESNNEDTKQVFLDVLTEMGIEITGMRFHTVHRCSLNQSSAPRHIITKFDCHEDKDYVWQNQHKMKDFKEFKEAFFVPDLVKEQAR